MVFLLYEKKPELAHLGEGVAFPWILFGLQAGYPRKYVDLLIVAEEE